MGRLEPVKPKIAEERKRISDFQKSLGDAIVLLLEVKCRNGITQSDRIEIDNIVDELQMMIREIPDAVSRSWFEKVFGVIRKAIGLWQELFSD